MVIEKEINPVYSLYFLGAEILSELLANQTMDFIDLYKRIKSSYNISIKLFILALDWLFLLDAIMIDDNGNVVKCL